MFLHFQDDSLLRKTVILQNQWATDAVFRVLDDEAVKRAKGHFTQADCRRLWAEPHYVDMDQEMLGLMEKFELCYRLADRHEPTWLAPRLLPPSKPAAFSNWASPSDLVVRVLASGLGEPADGAAASFYQAVRDVVGAWGILRAGGHAGFS